MPPERIEQNATPTLDETDVTIDANRVTITEAKSFGVAEAARGSGLSQPPVHLVEQAHNISII